MGKTYRAKKPQEIFAGGFDDRTVLYIGQFTHKVQYDSPTVKLGNKYPSVEMRIFLKWASHEVTE